MNNVIYRIEIEIEIEAEEPVTAIKYCEFRLTEACKNALAAHFIFAREERGKAYILKTQTMLTVEEKQ